MTTCLLVSQRVIRQEVEIYAVTLQHETAASGNSVGYDAEGGNGEFARGACERSSIVIARRPPRDAATGDHEGDGGEGVRFRWVPRQKFLKNGENIGGIMAAMVRAGESNELANPRAMKGSATVICHAPDDLNGIHHGFAVAPSCHVATEASCRR